MIIITELNFFNAFLKNINRYPEWCVRKNDAVRYLRCDSDEICASFFDDLKQRFPSMFDKPLKFTSQSLYWQHTLPTAVQGPKSFLTNLNPNADDPRTRMFSATNNSTTKVHQLHTGFKYETKLCGGEQRKSNSSNLSPVIQDNKIPAGPTTNLSSEYSKLVKTLPSKQIIKTHIDQQTKKTSVTKQKNPSNQTQKDFKVIPDTVTRNVLSKQELPNRISPKYNADSSTGNIIDIPDSPFDQLVPDELLLVQGTSSSSNEQMFQEENKGRFKRTKKVREEEHSPLKNHNEEMVDLSAIKSQRKIKSTSKDENATLKSYKKNKVEESPRLEGSSHYNKDTTRGFFLVDESLFDGESQLVPDGATNESRFEDSSMGMGHDVEMETVSSVVMAEKDESVVPTLSLDNSKHGRSSKGSPMKRSEEEEDVIFPKHNSFMNHINSGTVIFIVKRDYRRESYLLYKAF